MNWGKWLIVVMTVFIAFIVTLVTILISQDVDLVNDNYYKSEQVYQLEIDALKNGLTKDKFEVSEVSNQLVFNFIDSSGVDSIKVNFWRPNNGALDRSFLLTDAKPFLIPISDLVKGNYTIRCQFWKDSETYVQEEAITIKG